MATSTATTVDEYLASLPEDVDIDSYLAHYEEARGSSRQTRAATRA